MPEIGTFGLMSGDGKRSVGHRPQATAPILDSTKSDQELPIDRISCSSRPLNGLPKIFADPTSSI